MMYRAMRYWLGGLVLFGGLCAQAQAVMVYCCDATAEANFMTDLANLGFAVDIRSEGFEPTLGGAPTPWEPAITTPQPVVNVPAMGVSWSRTNSANPGFRIGTLGGAPKEGQYGMYLDGLLTTPGAAMSYGVQTDGFKLYGFGGWFKGSGAKPVFTPDGGTPIEPGGPLGLDWEFRGFIDENPAGGFMQLTVADAEAGGDEIKIFFTDAVTLAAVPLPASLLLFSTALFGLIGTQRWLRRA